MRPLLLLAAVAVDVWAVQTYGLRVEADLDRFVLVAFVAHLPVAVASLRAAAATAGGPSAARLARALLPSVLVVAGLGWVVVASHGPTSSWSALADATAAATFGWLVVAGLVVAPRRDRPGGLEPRPSSRLRHALRAGAGVVLVGMGLAMPATSRGLLEQDRLGMAAQAQAVLTGYGDPAATRLVAAYAVAVVVLLLLDVLLHRRDPDRPAQSSSVMPTEWGALSRKP